MSPLKSAHTPPQHKIRHSTIQGYEQQQHHHHPNHHRAKVVVVVATKLIHHELLPFKVYEQGVEQDGYAQGCQGHCEDEDGVGLGVDAAWVRESGEGCEAEEKRGGSCKEDGEFGPVEEGALVCCRDNKV